MANTGARKTRAAGTNTGTGHRAATGRTANTPAKRKMAAGSKTTGARKRATS